MTPDTDGDGLTDRDEVQTTSTNPLLWDTSGDGFSDSENHFGLGDPNGDLDGDGLINGLEQANGFDMRDADSNDDGVSDYDQYYAIDNANSDVDGDGLTYQEEVALGTLFLQADTDNDGFNDGAEVAAGSNPLDAAENPNNLGWNVDSDGDGLSNYAEINVHFSDPNSTDSDGDGVQDGMEVLVHGCDPTVVDSDGDGLPDGYELGFATAFRNGEIPVIFTSPATPDSDADGLDDDFETNPARCADHPTNPWVADSDGDRLSDGFEVLITLTFPDDSDSDDDGIGDFEDAHAGQADTDGDGISDSYETGVYLTNPQVADTDGDALSDGAEVGLPTPATYATDPRLKDTDGDGLEDGFELSTSLTDPRFRDTNNDGLSDSDNYHGTDSRDQDGDTLTNDEETALGTNPLLADTDGDGLRDNHELRTSLTSPLLADTDSDGLSDGYELSHSYQVFYSQLYTNPLDDDSDDDGLNDGYEVHTSLTQPVRPDSDNDGLNDSEELLIYSTNPLNAHTLSAVYPDWNMVSLTDTDSGGIPDRIESFYGMDPNTNNDDLNGDLDGDHIKNIEAFNQGWSLRANYNQLFDNDGDGMTDAWEVFHGLNPHDTTDRGGDPDHDWICNLEEFRFGTNPQVPDDFESVLGYALQLVLFNGRSLVWSASGTADWDGDLKSNEHEMAIGTDPRTYQAPISNAGGGGSEGGGSEGGGGADDETVAVEVWIDERVYVYNAEDDEAYLVEIRELQSRYGVGNVPDQEKERLREKYPGATANALSETKRQYFDKIEFISKQVADAFATMVTAGLGPVLKYIMMVVKFVES